MEGQETLYTVKETAERFKVNHRTVLDWIKSGEMACYEVGQSGMIRVGESHIQEYLENHKAEKRENPHDNEEE